MATSILPERTNWYKCSRLLIEGGMSILKEFLKKSCSPGSLDQFLTSCESDLTVLRKKNILSSSQLDKLFPHSDIEILDITLLTCIISNFIIQPQSSQKIALDGIRDLRNSLYGHVCHLSMNSDEFMNNWQLISTALTKAQLEFGTNISLKDFIDTVEKEEIVNGDEWRTELEIWKRKDVSLQEIQQTLEKQSSEISQQNVRISNIEVEMKENSVKVSNMEGDVIYLKATIGQKRSIASEGSNDDSASGSIKKKSQQKVISSARVKRGSSKFGSIKQKKSERKNKLPALDKQDLSELQICLVKYYTKYYMKSPVTATASSGCETDIYDIYVEPELKLVNPRHIMSISLRGLLPQVQNKCYNIYITGEAGMGKTSLCKYILARWCKACQEDNPNDDLEMDLKQYDFLFYVSLRNASDQHDIQDMIVSQLLKFIASNNELLSRFKPESLLQKLFEQSSRKCLIILDGLEEWTAQGRSKTPFISDGVPGRNPSFKHTIMTTTRPWKLEELRLKDSEIDRQIEIIGVKSISTFAEMLITVFNTKLNEKKTYNDFVKCFSKVGLNEMQTIPILFKYLICLWFYRQDFGKSKTEVYTNIIDLCFENAENREGVKDLRQPRHISTDPSIITPGVFKGKEKCNKYKDILKAVGKLAFETAMDQNGRQLVFNSRGDLTDDQIQICLTVGILTQSIAPSIVCEEKSISFMHKTIHEYFAALYMGWLSSIPEEKFRLKKTNIYDRDDIFIFLSGIWPSVSGRLLETFLADTYDKDITWDPEDIVKARLQTIVMRSCIESLNQNEHCPRVDLRVITFDIDDCESLLSSCTSLLRSRLNIEGLDLATFDKSSYCRGFFTIISQMSQKNILQTKGENCVLDLSELCGLKHLFLRYLKLDSLLVSPTLFTLDLDDIEIDTCHGMTALLSSIVQAESLNYFFCRNVRCENREFTVNMIEQQESVTSIKSTDQVRNIHCTRRTSKKYFLHMDLSNLTRLGTIKLENMSISRLYVSPVIRDLTLKDFEMAENDGIISLMKSVSCLETLDNIFMENIHCTEHKSNECYLHIDLSNLSRLRTINLKKLSISQLHVMSLVIEDLTLKEIEIAKHDGIDSLMKCVSSLETLDAIYMEHIYCTDYESNECYLHIDLTKLTRLDRLYLINMSISDLHVMSPVIKTLTLKDIKIEKHNGIFSLMISVSSLATLDAIYMNNIHCTEHETNECYLHTDLSKLTRLDSLYLKNMSIRELHVMNPVIRDLTLKDIKIAKHNEIDSLMKCVSSQTTLEKIYMTNIHCTEHKSYECYLHIDLSNLTTLRTIKLKNMSISELHVMSQCISDLTLKDGKIAKHKEIVSLMKSVSSLEILTLIDMNNIHCKEHASNEECFLNIELSKLTRLHLTKLENMSISELHLRQDVWFLTLKDIKIETHDGIVSLMKSVSSLERLTKKDMNNIHCTEHASHNCFQL